MAFFILSDVYDLSEQVGIEPPRLAGRQLATISCPHNLTLWVWLSQWLYLLTHGAVKRVNVFVFVCNIISL